MKRFSAIAMLPLCAGFLLAQVQTESRTTTTKTTWNGTLVDAACQSTHSEHHESTSQNSAGQTTTTRTDTNRTESVACPVTTTTTTFGLLTSDGRFIRFDQPSNTRVVEIMRGNPAWNREIAQLEPVQVHIVGTANGDVAVVDTMSPEVAVPVTGEAARVANPAQVEAMFDVRYHDDHGKLVVDMNGVRFEDISNANHSRAWNYAQIKELKRDSGNELKIQPYSGDKYELHVDGPFMSDTVYNMIAERIAASRAH